MSLMNLVAYGTPDFFWSNIHYNNTTPVVIEWNDAYRLILDTDRNKECPVTMEPINYGDIYCKCAECKYNFSEVVIANIEKTKNCPMCRTEWSDFTHYKNENFEDEIIKAINENIQI